MEERGVFAQLESLLGQVETTFAAMAEKFPDEVRCKPGCDDCCHACFDVSLIETLYLEAGLKTLSREDLETVQQQAAEAAKEMTRLKSETTDERPGHEQASLWRLRCPLLGEDKQCMLYEFRPLTCRAYGLPTSINDQGHVCGFSGFDQGATYPTIKLDQIFGYVYELSRQAAASLELAEEEAAKRRFVHQIVLEDRL